MREEENKVHEDLATAPQRQAKAAVRSTVFAGNPFILVLIDGCVPSLGDSREQRKIPARLRRSSRSLFALVSRFHSSAAPFNEDAISQGVSGGIDMGNRVRCVRLTASFADGNDSRSSSQLGGGKGLARYAVCSADRLVVSFPELTVVLSEGRAQHRA